MLGSLQGTLEKNPTPVNPLPLSRTQPALSLYYYCLKMWLDSLIYQCSWFTNKQMHTKNRNQINKNKKDKNSSGEAAQDVA